jgi:hypothetical protein
MTSRTALLERRRRRIEELTRENLDERVRTGLRRVWEQGRSPDVVRVRPVFIRTGGVVHDGRPRARPAAARLLRPRGIALRFYLLVLFEAQCRKGPSANATNVMRLAQGDGEVTWVDLIAVDAADQRRTKEPRTRLDNRVRQVKGALDTLHEEGLVELERANGARRYGGFTLMHESGRGELATPRTYTVPKANEGTVNLPVGFFLNGWVHVLQPSEIAIWLMFRDLAWRFPNEHLENGVYIYGDARQEEYGLNRDAYEGHDVLRGLGLLQFAPALREGPDGTITFRLPSRYDPHRFQLIDEGLSQLAVPATLKLLDQQLARQRETRRMY